MHVDELFSRLKRSGLGCYVGHVFCGGLGYADDVVVMAPTESALRRMLRICSEFADEFSLIFNPAKSKYIALSSVTKRTTPKTIKWGSEVINRDSTAVHLGNVIGHNSNTVSISSAVKDLYLRVNVLRQNFSFCSLDVKYALFRTRCMAMYGSQLWDFSTPGCNTIFVAWRKSLRCLLGLDPRTRSHLLPLIVRDSSVKIQLHRRSLKFIVKALGSFNVCTRLLAERAMAGSNSRVSRSIRFLCEQYNLDPSRPSLSSLARVVERGPEHDHEVTAGAVRDFVNLRDDGRAGVIDRANARFIVNTLCVN